MAETTTTMKIPKVFVYGRDHKPAIAALIDEGFTLTNILDIHTDLVVFLGGPDISPTLYGESKMRKTDVDIERDAKDIAVIQAARDLWCPAVGIGRGAHLLNVAGDNDGKLWQHVNNHNAPHAITDVVSGKEVYVCGNHHQMMIPGKDGFVVAEANMCTYRESPDRVLRGKRGDDPEVIWYEDTQSLCAQFNPFWINTRTSPARRYFFDILNHYIGEPWGWFKLRSVGNTTTPTSKKVVDDAKEIAAKKPVELFDQTTGKWVIVDDNGDVVEEQVA